MQLFKLSSHHPTHLMQLCKLSLIQIKNRRLYKLLELNKLLELHINTIGPSLFLDIMLDKQAIAIFPFLTEMYRICCVLIVTTWDS